MLFTRFYLTQRQNLETWFVLPGNGGYFAVESTTFLSTNWQKKCIYWYKELLNMFFFIGVAVKIAFSFNKCQCVLLQKSCSRFCFLV